MRIGLTGGIGSGKSTVAALFAHLGAAVIDTDLIARALAAPGGAAIDAIRAAFGAESIDATGALDRSRMRALAFADADAKRRLEAILHPLVGQEVESQAATAAAPVIVFDIPLLVETGHWLARVDRVWVVDCREATQVARVMARSGWDAATVAAVLAQQATSSARRARADVVVFNDGIGLEELAREVRALWHEAIALSRSWPSCC